MPHPEIVKIGKFMFRGEKGDTNLLSEFLSLSNHAVNLFLAETAFLVGDSDALRLTTEANILFNGL